MGRPHSAQPFWGQSWIVVSERQVAVDGTTMGEVRHRRRQTYSAVRVPVCRHCNNNWMSRIENEARPLVEPMIRRTRTGIPVRDQVKIARWMALKTLVADLIDHGYPTFEADDYQAFYKDPNPPEQFNAALGRLTPGGSTTSTALQPLLTARTLNGVPAETPLALNFGLSFGPVYFQTLYPSIRAQRYPRPREDRPNPWWTRIWPQRGEANWPPPSPSPHRCSQISKVTGLRQPNGLPRTFDDDPRLRNREPGSATPCPTRCRPRGPANRRTALSAT